MTLKINVMLYYERPILNAPKSVKLYSVRIHHLTASIQYSV